MRTHRVNFVEWEVRAVIERRKTMFRRLVKPDYHPCITGDCAHDKLQECFAVMAEESPHGKPGDTLLVMETWRPWDGWSLEDADQSQIDYRADGLGPRTATQSYWRSPQTMPPWASRITLEVESVRAERLQDITEEEATLEGMKNGMQCGYLDNGTSSCSDRCKFKAHWNSDKRNISWENNPFVVVTKFKVLGITE